MDTEKIKNWLKKNLSDERYQHLLGAEKTACELAERFGVDPQKAALAALVHDCAKSKRNEELIHIIKEKNLSVSNLDLNNYKTLHAPVGAYLAKKEFGIEDTEILRAIKCHTIGRINMTDLEKIVFLADKIEPNTRDSEFRAKVLNILDKTKNLDEALLICYDATIRSLLDRKLIINSMTIDVWNSLIEKLNK
jgi:predicted HD superfamily hydrolase involved in NAD metabolism